MTVIDVGSRHVDEFPQPVGIVGEEVPGVHRPQAGIPLTAIAHRCIVVLPAACAFVGASEAHDTYNALAGSVISDAVLIHRVLNQRKSVHGHIHIPFVTAEVWQVVTCIGVWCARFGEEHDVRVYGLYSI